MDIEMRTKAQTMHGFSPLITLIWIGCRIDRPLSSEVMENILCFGRRMADPWFTERTPGRHRGDGSRIV